MHLVRRFCRVEDLIYHRLQARGTSLLSAVADPVPFGPAWISLAVHRVGPVVSCSTKVLG